MKGLIDQLNRLILHPEAQRWALAKKDGSNVLYPHMTNYLTPRDLERGLNGEISLGVMLAQEKSSLVKAGAIDLDVPRDAKDLPEALDLAKKLQEMALKEGLKAYIEFSGGRGYHVWIFALEPISANLMQLALKAIAIKAKFEAQEIFPNDPVKETKCIKLPGVINLKTGKRCGFIGDHDPLNPEIELEKQAELMQSFEQNSVDSLLALGESVKQNLSTENQDSDRIKKIIKSFGAGNHPTCIKHLAERGAPLQVDYNQVNLTIARYVVTKEEGELEAIALAYSMAKNTSDTHPTSKDFNAKIKNFESALKSAKSDPNRYEFNCSYVLANLGEAKPIERGCIGKECPVYSYTPQKEVSRNGTFLPLNRLIFQTIGILLGKEKEVCKSLILAGVENLRENTQPSLTPDTLSESQRLKEAEALAKLIEKPALLSMALDVDPIGFQGLTDMSILAYLETLFTLEIPSEDTVRGHFDEIRERGVKTLASKEMDSAKYAISKNSLTEALSTHSEKIGGLVKKSVSDVETAPLEAHVPELIDLLFTAGNKAIASFSPHLNAILGGFKKGAFYVLGGLPAGGKSTCCFQLADFACAKGHRVVIASFEMGRVQLYLAALSRISKINSSLLETLNIDTTNLQSEICKAIEIHLENVASNQIILEADASYTPSKLKAICKKVGAEMLIVDYLQLVQTGDEKLDSSNQETLRVSKLATDLKRVARDLAIPVIAVSDINKDAYLKAQTGSDLNMGALRDSFKISHAADAILLLQSGKISTEKDGKNSADQLDLLIKKYPDKAQAITGIRSRFPLNPLLADTYARISVVKNRGGKLGEPIFKYSRAIHTFEPLDLSFEFNQEVI